jgi:hypothetical protein
MHGEQRIGRIGHIGRIAHSRTEAIVSRGIIAYKWFDTLGYPDIGKLSFDQIADGIETDVIRQRANHHAVGFLVEEKGETFSVFSTELRIVTFKKAAPSGSGSKRVGYDDVDLLQWA